MKRIVCTIFILLLTCSNYANEKIVEVRLDETYGPRSSVNISPVVTINGDSCELSVFFPIQGKSYSVTVTDNFGNVVIQQYTVSGDFVQYYLLPLMSSCSYTIVLISDNGKYIGIFGS